MKTFFFGGLRASFDSLSVCAWRCARCESPVLQATKFILEVGSTMAFKKCSCGVCVHWTDEPGPRDAHGWARVVRHMQDRNVDLVLIEPASEDEPLLGRN
jgi:hypothetical protein